MTGASARGGEAGGGGGRERRRIEKTGTTSEPVDRSVGKVKERKIGSSDARGRVNIIRMSRGWLQKSTKIGC